MEANASSRYAIRTDDGASARTLHGLSSAREAFRDTGGRGALPVIVPDEKNRYGRVFLPLIPQILRICPVGGFRNGGIFLWATL